MKDLVTRRHPVHRDVEIGTEKTHRQEELNCEQDDPKRSGKIDLPVQVTADRDNHTQSRSAVGDDVHDNDGVQLHLKNFHRDDAKALALSIHLLGFLRVRAVYFQRCHALKVLKEAVAETCVNIPVL